MIPKKTPLFVSFLLAGTAIDRVNRWHRKTEMLRRDLQDPSQNYLLNRRAIQRGKQRWISPADRGLVGWHSPFMPFDPLELADHFKKHRADFTVLTDRDYEAMADHFFASPPAPHVMECIRTRGDVIRYDTITTEYAVRSSAGIIRTYFKPVPCSSIQAGAPRVPCHNFVDNVAYFRYTCTSW